MSQVLRQRTLEDLRESTLYGKLYRIVSKHNNKFIAHRIRRRGETLWMMRGERVVIEKTPQANLPARVGDFVFQDADKRYALWAAMIDIEVKNER
jgi:hypothetical protein